MVEGNRTALRHLHHQFGPGYQSEYQRTKTVPAKGCYTVSYGFATRKVQRKYAKSITTEVRSEK